MRLGIFLSSFTTIVYGAVIVVESIKKGRSVCLTDECRNFAEAVTTSMNASMDPCVDFYEYACGNWPEMHPIPAGKNTWRVLTVAAEENKRKVEDLLKRDTDDDEIPPVRIAKKWYRACVDTDNTEKRGMEPLLSLMNEIDGWPMTMARNNWNASAQKWQDVDDYYAHLKGSNLLHETRVAAFYGNSSEYGTALDVPDLPPSTWMLDVEFDEAECDNSTEDSDYYDRIVNCRRKFKRDDKYWGFVSKIVTTLIEAAGLSVPQDRLEEDVYDILNFQWKLSKISSQMDDYANMTLAGFQKWYDDLGSKTENSKVNWTKKVMAIFEETSIDFPVNANLKVSSPEYFKKLVPLLNKTPNQTIVNYLHWSFLSRMISKTTEEMRELYDRIISGDEEDEEAQSRSQRCIEESKMNEIIAYEYIRMFFSDDTLNTAMNALDDIREEMEIEIKKSTWANEEIEELALRRIRSIKRNIAYPDWYNNATAVRGYFDGLILGPTYFENALSLEKYYKLKELRALRHKNGVESWIIDPLTINAFYLSKTNSITVPAANLQKPFFSEAQPNTINYALTGYLLAHEMCHPFDGQRRVYDEHGDEIQWPETMIEKYNKSLNCFVRQFDNYTLDGTPSGPKIKNYGNQTVDENMSDTMGLMAAFRAYKRREKINGKPDEALPGLEMFNNNQLFFLSFANLWCENIEPNFLVTLAKLDIHGTGRLRAIGALSNNKDFAEAFSCPLGSPMNPEKKCNIWKQ